MRGHLFVAAALAACGKSDKPASTDPPPPPPPAADASLDAAPVPGAKLTVKINESVYASGMLVDADAVWMPDAKLIVLATKGAVACPPAKPKEYGPDDFAVAFQLDDAVTLGTHTARNQWHMKAASGGIMEATVTLTGLDPLTGSVRADEYNMSFIGDFVAARCDPPTE
ncbi:MAG TPA: hypothetical protein VM261_23655 [Kofleriaceae bacterium]|nr:hypothetical protein [Kofleriaceae bacterium]